MPYFIDRRLNPKGKSLANRQRFLRRARAQIREAVQKSLKDSAVADIAKERKVKISTKGTQASRASASIPRSAGERDFVLPGNKRVHARRRDQEAQIRRGRAAARTPRTTPRARTISNS